MIQVSMYNIDKDCCTQLLCALERCTAENDVPYRIMLNTDNANDVIDFLADGHQAAMCIIGIDNLLSQSDLTGIKLSRKALSLNRDHYIVLILKNPGNLEDVLSVCTRLAGVLCIPIAVKRMDNMFREIFRDYKRAYLMQATQDEFGFITLKESNKVHRLRCSEIRFIQALNKKVEVDLGGKCLQMYANMTDIMTHLGDSFIRCHRSYIVNIMCVKQIDWTGMLLFLDDETQLPISRTYRADLKRAFEHVAGSSPGIVQH